MSYGDIENREVDDIRSNGEQQQKKKTVELYAVFFVTIINMSHAFDSFTRIESRLCAMCSRSFIVQCALSNANHKITKAECRDKRCDSIVHTNQELKWKGQKML